uniref:Uncharacterized protein n=1 Tax=Pseudomonas phage HRDY3 TaxID=3236930 RepID=A0AB39CEU2_9VIRU
MRTELPNAYGSMVHDGVEFERTPGWFNIWPDKERGVHVFEFSDGCYRADMPVSLETLKAMREKIDNYVKEKESEAQS